MKKTTIKKLKDKQIEFIINHDDFSEGLEETANEIIEAVQTSATTEATVASIFEINLYDTIKNVFGLKFYPIKEDSVYTKRHVATSKRDKRGRIDSRIGALVIEYKFKGKLQTIKQKDEAIQQIRRYLEGLYAENPREYVGFITDGKKANFIVLDENKNITEGAYAKLSGIHLEKIVKTIVLLEKSAFTPENLVKDFCQPEDKNVAKELSLVLFDVLEHQMTNRTQMLFNEWRELFRLAHDDQSKQQAIEDRRKSLSKVIGRRFSDNSLEYLTLYALQTAYAIIVKIIAYKFISKIKFKHSFISFTDLASRDSETIRSQLNRLEEGAIFRDLGIGNLLEGDFFAWYCVDDQWSDEIAKVIKKVFSVLTNYEDTALFQTSDKVQDLFKDLYLCIMPDKVRHSLGEFYTPQWLADHLVSTAITKIDNTSWSALDPCAGSGTFITALIRYVLKQTKGQSNRNRLFDILNRVKAIDLNPLAVLTSRINFFINISHLISEDDRFEIPVYLGDSSFVPSHVSVDNVPCLSYTINTLQGVIDITLPKSVVRDSHEFSKAMTSIELDIANHDDEEIANKLIALIDETDKQDNIMMNIRELAAKFVELEKNHWNGIWARIVTNFLSTANIGKFDLIVGNPPWIDWKNLPEGYRERIKSLCIDKRLFSGDSLTGGINLNICALISNVAADNWLKNGGVLAFLMPENLIFQQTYEGFRKFYVNHDKRLYFQEFFDWTKSGHPFAPVQHKFLTFFISNKVQDYSKGVPVKSFIKKTRKTSNNVKSLKYYRSVSCFDEISHIFEIVEKLAITPNPSNTCFSYAKSSNQSFKFSQIAGVSEYIGRDGIDFYPQELFLLLLSDMKAPRNTVYVTNYQNPRSKLRIAEQTRILETEYLYPLIKSINIERFHVSPPKYFVPFPYEDGKRSPIERKKLSKAAPLLMKYFNDNKKAFERKTNYNKKIGGKHHTEFYSLTRVGEYTYGNHFVAFRKDTKWVASVVGAIETPWGEKKVPRFQSHAVYISQTYDGRFITFEEAHYICAILNAPIIADFIINSSDKRSFKVRTPIRIPLYEPTNENHRRLVELSQNGHNNYANQLIIRKIDKELNDAYLSIL